MAWKVIAPQGTRWDNRHPIIDKLFRYPAFKETPEGWMTWQEHPIDGRYGALFMYDATKFTIRDGEVYRYTDEEREWLEMGRKRAELEAKLNELQAKQEHKKFELDMDYIREVTINNLDIKPANIKSPSKDFLDFGKKLGDSLTEGFEEGVKEVSDKDSIRDTRRSRPFDPSDAKNDSVRLDKDGLHINGKTVVANTVTPDKITLIPPVIEPKLIGETIKKGLFTKSIYRKYETDNSEVLEVTEVYFVGIRYKYTSEKRRRPVWSI